MATKTPTTPAILLKALKAKKTNAQALAIVEKLHPRTKMTIATVNWYRNRFRRAGETIPTELEVNRKR